MKFRKLILHLCVIVVLHMISTVHLSKSGHENDQTEDSESKQINQDSASPDKVEAADRLSKTDAETQQILEDFRKNPSQMMCVGILSKIPQQYFDKQLEKFKKQIFENDEAKFALYFEKFVMRGLANCVDIANNAEKSKLIGDVEGLFQRNTWVSNLERYFEFDYDVFLKNSPSLDQSESKMKQLYESVTLALRVIIAIV